MPALTARGKVFAAHELIVDLRHECVGFDEIATIALQVVDAAVDFVDSIIGIGSFLEVTVDVGCHCEDVGIITIAVFPFDEVSHLPQEMIPFMRFLFSVHFKPRPIEPPKKMRVSRQKLRVGAFPEIKLSSIWRIVVPEAILPSKIWKSRIDAKTCACTNQNSGGLLDEFRCFLHDVY
jgi:hypothetical protein